MSRLALLLGNPKANGITQDAMGTANDMDYWERFLESEQGGLWTKGDEIIQLKPQSKQELLPRIIELTKKEKPQYLMFIFSGHGISDVDNDYIFIDSNECMSVSRLKEFLSQCAHSGLLFLDACRNTTLTARTALNAQMTFQCSINCSSNTNDAEVDKKIRQDIANSWWTKQVTCESTTPFSIIQSCLKGNSAVEVHDLTSNKYYGAFTRMFLDTGFSASNETSMSSAVVEANHKMESELNWSMCHGYIQEGECNPPDIPLPFAIGMQKIDEIKKKYTLNE